MLTTPTSNLLREKLRTKNVLVGMQCFSGSPALLEIMGYAGFDWVSIDTEHTSTTIAQVEHLVRAADASGIVPLVRISHNDPIEIMKALDVGAAGVIVPHITSAQDLRAAVAACRYPPDGERGVCRVVRATKYSLRDWKEYFPQANAQVTVVPLVEDPEAIKNFDEILDVDGVDLIFISSGDLAQAYNCPGADFTDPRLSGVIREVNEKARAKGKALMATASPLLTREYAEQLIAAGFRAISFGADEGVFAKACKEIASIAR